MAPIDEIEEGAGHRLGERAAGGIVDADAPGLEPHGDAAREQAVGRDQRGRAPRRLRRLAQDQRHHLGLVLRRRRLDEADAGERRAHALAVGRLGVVVPAPRRARRAHRLGDERGAVRLRGRRARCPRARARRSRSSPSRSSSVLQAELRVLGVARGDLRAQLSSSRCGSSPGSTIAPWGSAATARISSTVAGIEPVTPATMTGPAGGDAARRSRLGEDRPVAPRRRRQQALLCEMRRPRLGDDLQELDRLLPVLGELLRHQRRRARRAPARRGAPSPPCPSGGRARRRGGRPAPACWRRRPSPDRPRKSGGVRRCGA